MLEKFWKRATVGHAMDFCLDFTRSNFSDMPKLCILGLAQMGFPAGFGSGDKSI